MGGRSSAPVPRWLQPASARTSRPHLCRLVATESRGQLQTAAALIQPALTDRVRERQHLEPDTPEEQVYPAVVGSITKTCDLQRQPGRSLAQIVQDLYESS
jgi:hypothetical protein